MSRDRSDRMPFGGGRFGDGRKAPAGPMLGHSPSGDCGTGGVMTRSRLTPMAGFAALVGGLLWLMALGVAQAASSQFAGLIAVPTLFLVVGIGGLQLRRATRRGVLSKAGSTLALVGSLMLAYGSIGRLDFS